MALPARHDSTDHLLITAHLYWLTARDGEGSKGIQYTREAAKSTHKDNEALVCVLPHQTEKNTCTSKRYSRSSTHTPSHKVKNNGKNDGEAGIA